MWQKTEPFALPTELRPHMNGLLKQNLSRHAYYYSMVFTKCKKIFFCQIKKLETQILINREK